MAGFDDLVSASAESLLTENLRLREGVSWNVGWTVLDGNSDIVDFTGTTASFAIRDKVGGTTLFEATHTDSNGRRIVLFDGSVTITATPSGSNFNLQDDFRGVYELRLTKSGKIVSLVSGKVTIYRGV